MSFNLLFPYFWAMIRRSDVKINPTKIKGMVLDIKIDHLSSDILHMDEYTMCKGVIELQSGFQVF
jgi:hypothetical protein